LKHNLEYLYKHKGKSKVFIKTLNFVVNGREKEYYKLFEKYCDNITIENVVKTYDEMDELDILPKENKLNISGNLEAQRLKVCPFPFYQLTINALGNVSACCGSLNKELYVGNINLGNIVEMWNGEKISNFRKQLLTETRFSHDICKNCLTVDYGARPEDILDSDASRLYELY
jgi:radical SAM protein with 4Fe4S-binding SPASM domain